MNNNNQPDELRIGMDINNNQDKDIELQENIVQGKDEKTTKDTPTEKNNLGDTCVFCGRNKGLNVYYINPGEIGIETNVSRIMKILDRDKLILCTKHFNQINKLKYFRDVDINILIIKKEMEKRDKK